MFKKLYNSRREHMISLRKTGLTYADIGRELGLTRERVRQIVTGGTTAKKKPARNNPHALLTTGEAAELLNVHVNTVRRWSNKEILTTHRIGPRGDRRFRQQDINNFLMNNPAGTTDNFTSK